MFALFTSLAGLWGWMVWSAKQNAHKIHWIMLVLVVLKSLTVLMQGGMYHTIGRTGHPEGWNVAYVSAHLQEHPPVGACMCVRVGAGVRLQRRGGGLAAEVGVGRGTAAAVSPACCGLRFSSLLPPQSSPCTFPPHPSHTPNTHPTHTQKKTNATHAHRTPYRPLGARSTSSLP